MKTKPTQIEVISRGLLRSGQFILACRSVKGNYYYLPGGHIDPDETASNALKREFLEESGENIDVGPLLLACEVRFSTGSERHHEYNFVFHVERNEPSGFPPPRIRSRERSIAFEWIDQAAIADVDFRPRVIRAWLAAGCWIESPHAGWISVAE
ncbi:MAG: NUDIX domain-containing protein [Phycisphaerae bacterium]|nr:NUDIX domain-containing protein [Phycisphaerae bacterium]